MAYSNILCLCYISEENGKYIFRDINDHRQVVISEVKSGEIKLVTKDKKNELSMAEIACGFFNPKSNLLDFTLRFRDEIPNGVLKVKFQIKPNKYIVVTDSNVKRILECLKT